MARLTTMARGGGCGCKLGKSALAEALALMPGAPADARVLAFVVGFGGAATRRRTACGTTWPSWPPVNFFTPHRQRPGHLRGDRRHQRPQRPARDGREAGLRARGGGPPGRRGPRRPRRDHARGRRGRDGRRLSGAGGPHHRRPRAQYGLAAVGTAHPERLLSNAAGRPGDLLFLTKPLGVGVIATAAMRDGCNQDAGPPPRSRCWPRTAPRRPRPWRRGCAARPT